MAKHTPGPWKWWTSNSWKRLMHENTGATIRILELCVCSDGHPDLYVSEANARLIASAPDLLGALEKIVDMNVQYCIDKYGDASRADSMACVEIARAAIAKATGDA